MPPKKAKRLAPPKPPEVSQPEETEHTHELLPHSAPVTPRVSENDGGAAASPAVSARMLFLEKRVADLSLREQRSSESIEILVKQLQERDEQLQQQSDRVDHLRSSVKKAREGLACELPDVASIGFSSYFAAMGWTLLNTANRGMPEKEIVERLRLLAAMTGCKEEIPKLRHLKHLHPLLKPDVYKLVGAPANNNTVALVSEAAWIGGTTQ